MRITKISVKGLFGMFDHEIPLNQESRITIVYGPNGVGKSVLMRMVHDLFHYDNEFLTKIPFDELHIVFENSEFITVKYDEHQKADDEIPAFIIGYGDGEGKAFYRLSTTKKLELTKLVKIHLPDFELIKTPFAGLIWVNRSEGGESFLYEKAIPIQYPELQSMLYQDMSEWFVSILNEVNPKLFSTKRLTTEEITSEMLIYLFSDDSPRVVSSGDKLADFPANTESYTDFFFRMQEAKAEIDSHTSLKEFREVKRWDSSVKMFLDIINERFLFKTLEYDFDDGDIEIDCRAEVKLSAENGGIVPWSSLSSGEQHLLILYDQLLFETEPDTLVMIDEPELSMNVVWQRNFLKDLQRIVELRGFDVLIATHSPQIIHDKWDWMVPLGAKVED